LASGVSDSLAQGRGQRPCSISGAMGRVGAEEPDFKGGDLQLAKGRLGGLRVVDLEVQKEPVLERQVRDGPRLQPGQVHPAGGEAGQRLQQASGLVRGDEGQRRLLSWPALAWAPRLAALGNQEAGLVRVVVLNTDRQDLEPIASCRLRAGDRSQPGLGMLRQLARRAGGVVDAHRLDVPVADCRGVRKDRQKRLFGVGARLALVAGPDRGPQSSEVRGWSQDIIPRSSAPTFSTWWSACSCLSRRNCSRPCAFSSIQRSAKLPSWISLR